MQKPEAYTFEAEGQRRHIYELRPEGITYHAPGREGITVQWEAIRYLRDVSGQRVEIVYADSAEAIPVFYGTTQFSRLLTRVCATLSGIHHQQIGTRTFTGSPSYIMHRRIVLSILTALLFAGLVYLHHFTLAWWFIIAATIPMIVYILRQPHTVTPEDDRLLVQDSINIRAIAYDRIKQIAFDFHGDRHIAYLCIIIRLHDNRDIKIQRFENLILLFIFMFHKWQMKGRTD